MAYVNTDSTYYGPKAKTVDVRANGVPFDLNSFHYASVQLVYLNTNYPIVANLVTGLKGRAEVNNSIEINSTDPRGSYRVFVNWHAASGAVIGSASSNIIYLTA